MQEEEQQRSLESHVSTVNVNNPAAILLYIHIFPVSFMNTT